MAIEESQLIDAPETPGHVFAYRAFRNFFVGSPDSSPIRPATSFAENKENSYPEKIRSPVKRSYNGTLTNTTPKRLRGNGASPSKSILRNPAEPTPRRAMLKDINVTFKDARKSATPETSLKVVPTGIKESSALQVSEMSTRKALSHIESVPIRTTEQHSRSTKTNPATTKKDTPTEDLLSTSVPFTDKSGIFDVKEYMQTTEKEMRKLLRYGQKMREIARKQEEESTRLRLLLTAAQKENARLQKELDNTKTARNRYTKETEHSKNTMDRTITPGDIRRKSSQRMSITKESMRMDAFNLPTNVESSQKPTTRSATRSLSSASKRKAEPFSFDQVETDDANQIRSTNPSRDNEPATNSTAISRIPPDRVAAAKERLRRRMEMRKVSGENNIVGEDYGVQSTTIKTGVSGDDRSKRKSSSFAEGNGSQLDWVGL